jgi:lipoprotein-releasing system permease protein
MGGLQNGLIKRNKNVMGYGQFNLSHISYNNSLGLIKELKEKHKNFTIEYEIEVMVKHENYINGVVLHGIDYDHFVPDFLKGKDKSEVILGSELARQLKGFYGSTLLFTSPAHTTFMLREIPRQGSSRISDFYSSELPEIDGVRGWVRLSFIQNLIGKRKVNTLRFFEKIPPKIITNLINKNPGLKYTSWEEKNSTLVWALNLETKVMLFLFVGMSLLIGICITIGFLIFYNKIKVDLASFWILGLSKDSLLNLIFYFGQIITIGFTALGTGLGILFLHLLKSNKFILMPEHFVERNIPVNLEVFHIFLSFIVPYSVACLFSYYTFRGFKKNNYSFISLIRKVG